MARLSDKIKEYRKNCGITQEELASRLFVSRQAVSKWEQGRGYPSTSILKDIAKLLDVTVDELISSEKDEEVVLLSVMTVGWTFKNHLIKKLLLFLVPAFISFMYMWIFTGIAGQSVILRELEPLIDYQARLAISDEYIQAAYFVIKFIFLPLVLNIVLYLFEVSGIISPKTFKWTMIILNIMLFAFLCSAPLIVCFGFKNKGLSLGLGLGCLIMIAMFAFTFIYFFFEANRASKLVIEKSKIQIPSIKRASSILLPIVFYIFYMCIFLSITFFSNDSSSRRNILATYKTISTSVGLLICIPIIITACLYFVLILRKTSIFGFLGIVLPINILPMLMAGFYVFMVIGMSISTDAVIRGFVFCVGLILTYLILICVLTLNLVKSYKKSKLAG